MKLLKQDRLFSLLVRTRANFTCEKCGRYYPEGQRQGLDCSHFFSRRNRSVRWDPKNAAAHCRGCHGFLGENPVLFNEWIRAVLGEAEFQLLQIRANTPRKFSKPELEDLYQEMKAELERMESERNAGVTGRIEFSLFDREVAAA